MTSTRAQVYDALDGERNYQDAKWPLPEHLHSFEEFAVYMEDYLAEMKHLLSRGGGEEAVRKASHIMRKVAAMGVACLEQNGVEYRDGW